MNARNSPTPWIYDKRHERIYSAENEPLEVCGVCLPCGQVPSDHIGYGNAEFVVRAVNAHEALVDALQKQQAYLNYLRSVSPVERFNIDDQSKTVNSALALARGEVKP